MRIPSGKGVLRLPAMIASFRKYAFAWLVVVSGLLPMIFRFDAWPLSTISMYSERANLDDIWSYQLYFRSEAGEMRPVPILCGKFCIYLFNKNLGVNSAVVDELMRALPVFSTGRPPRGPGALVLMKARKAGGAKDRSITIEKEMVAELALPAEPYE
jgi:hypothetical protein